MYEQSDDEGDRDHFKVPAKTATPTKKKKVAARTSVSMKSSASKKVAAKKSPKKDEILTVEDTSSDSEDNQGD